jgi:tetratricopeptide (TPR) repeat protein
LKWYAVYAVYNAQVLALLLGVLPMRNIDSLFADSTDQASCVFEEIYMLIQDHQFFGDEVYQKAVIKLENAAKVYKESGQRDKLLSAYVEANLHIQMGNIHAKQRNLEEALNNYNRSYVIYEQKDTWNGIINVLYLKGRLY